MPTTLEKALEYAELGYSVIPLAHGQKYPINEKWQQYAYETPTEDEIRKQWGSANYNVGIVCGPASKVVGVDIDDDDVLKDPMIPISNVARRGAKGEVRLFRWREGLSNYSGEKVQLLVDRRFFVVPPGGHPDGMNYEWTRGPLCEPDDLPELTDEVVAHITKTYPTRSGGPGGGGGPKNGGRNTSLTANITAWRHNETMDVDELAQMALEYDIKNHSHNPLFFDMTEQYAKKAGGGLPAAKVMVTNILKTIGEAPPPTELKIMSGKTVPKVEVVDDEEEEEEADYVEENIVNIFGHKLPESRCEIFRKYVELVNNSSPKGDIPHFATASALAFFSTCLGNRFVVNQGGIVVPNLYVYILGETARGKNAPLKILRSTLQGTELIGQGGRDSGQSLGDDLDKKKVLCEIYDEHHNDIKRMNSQMSNGALLTLQKLENQLFTSGDSPVPLNWSRSAEADKRARELHDAYYCKFAACTTPSFIAAFPKGEEKGQMFESGYMNRVLFFTEPPYQLPKTVEEFERLQEQRLAKKVDVKIIREWMFDFFRENPSHPGYSPGMMKPEPKVLKFSADAKKLFIRKQFFDEVEVEKLKAEGLYLDAAIIARSNEKIIKLALIDAAICGDQEVGVDSLNWAIGVEKHSALVALEVFGRIEGRINTNDDGAIEDRIMNTLLHVKNIPKSRLRNYLPRISSQKFNMIINHMALSKLIVETKTRGGSRISLVENKKGKK